MICVSVIVPYFKKKQYIHQTINSIKLQTHKNLDIIIIYDDEDHNELEIIKNISNKDKRIRVIVNKKNLGAGLSRNIGISKAKGKYIAFIDSDDVWKKNKVEYQLKYMIKKNLDISHTSYEILSKNKKKKKLKAKTFRNYTQLLPSCDIGLSTVMMKKELISKFCKFPNLKTKEDFVLWLLILKKNIIIGSVDKSLTIWRKLDSSLSSSIIQKLRDGFTLYNRFMRFNIFKSFFYLILLSVNSLRK